MSQFNAQLLAVVVTVALMLGPMLAAGLLLQWRKKTTRAQRRSPLTSHLLRPPGHTLRQQYEETRLDLMGDAFNLGVLPSYLLGSLYLQTLFSKQPMPVWLLAVVALLAIGGSSYGLVRMWRRSKKLDQLRLGLDAELATGQELDQLMRHGAVVFHDFPADGFNIDHIVIAPEGVLAVETKGYSKPNRRGGPSDARVVFDGTHLTFPDWRSDRPVQQALRQAQWLSKWLSSATGDPVRALPVLALPGWYVERRGLGTVRVFNGKELATHLLRSRDAQPLSAEQLRRVVHQVEQRCRDVSALYRDSDKAA